MFYKPSKERMSEIPGLYTTEHLEFQDKLIYLHFYLLDSHWWVCESNGNDTFFGFVLLNNNLQNAEWRYFTLWKLQQYNVQGFEVMLDKSWQIRPASQVRKIITAHGWNITQTQSPILANGGQNVR